MPDKEKEIKEFFEEYLGIKELEEIEEKLELNKLKKTNLKGIVKKILEKLGIKNKEIITLADNTKRFINEFEKIVIACKEKENLIIIKNILKFMANSVQGELFSKYYYNDRNYPSNYKDFPECVRSSITLGQYKNEIKVKEDITILLQEIPIISNVWDGDRIFSCLEEIGEINGNKFRDDNNNTDVVLVKPLGLILTYNGNHSINSVIINKDNAKIRINRIIDISETLNEYKFDGENYINITTSQKINDSFLKNNSKPFVYSLGLMFEMARILKKHNIDLTEKYLQKKINFL
ncbi:hypothetical protein JMUB3935_2310 [Leptotrichia trevisanii]|uniref:Uncharacterized protein n=1 Tax=Leptotrichia trevisanii TaxID=109328 RepID=A0A510KTC7_9FUSO|nr:DUF6710 family protein [Leptotrichia trevisanii]BBM53323.1 hypothetical protein JMUB3935_2310 [Leptotrichia trevisanii]